MKIHDLKPPDGARHERRRVGRGLGSGRGKTSGKGTKGQKARAGGGVPPYFEGGQLPLVRKLPYRRGFTNPFRVEYEVVNLDQLEALTGTSEVTPEGLRAAGLVGKGKAPVKVLARGSLTKKLTVHAHGFSAAARGAIEAAGGSVVRIGGVPEAEPEPSRKRRRAAVKAAEPAVETEAVTLEEEGAVTAAAPAAAEAENASPANTSAPARRRRARPAAEPSDAADETIEAAAAEDESADDA